MSFEVDEQDLRPAEEKLVKMELNEATSMVDHFEIERILNSAQVYGPSEHEQRAIYHDHIS